MFALGAVALSACGEPLRGTLTLSEAITINTNAGVRQLEAGAYPVKLGVSQDKIAVDVVSTTAGTVKLVIENGGAGLPTRSGTARVAAADSRQPFDLTYTVDTSSGGFGDRSYSQPCTYQVTETVCRFYGTSDEKESCFPVTSLRRGTRLVASENSFGSVTVTGQLVDPQSGRTVGQLHAWRSKTRDGSAESPCG